MEIHLSPDQEAKLSLDEDAEFRAAVRKGMEQADRGKFVSEEEMESRVRRMTGALE